MTTHTIGTRGDWLTARFELLEAEKECSMIADGFNGFVVHRG